MNSRQPRKYSSVLGCIVICLTLATPASVRAQVQVLEGFDLFETVQPTDFLGFSFEGVQIGSFDFGTGLIGTGTTDTIVERIDPASVAGTPNTASPIPIELVALQLKSVNPIDVGAGLDFHYITLQPNNPSSGEMTITFDNPAGGTFDSFIDVTFDLRIGGLNGQILASDVLRLSANGVLWDRTPPPGALLIPDVNHLLNGSDNTADIWPAEFTEAHPSGARHSVMSAVPEPATFAILGLGAVALLRRRRGKAH